LPLLTPMSEVAGRIAVQAGATGLQIANGGNGMLLGGVPGTPPASVVIVGAGVVGTESAKMALGLGADVTILDNNIDRLRYLDDTMGRVLKTRFSDAYAIEELTRQADLVIGSVLIPFRALLYRTRCGALLRHQHARRGLQDFNVCPDQCHVALCTGTGQ
jgi:alanine dehydrogenase